MIHMLCTCCMHSALMGILLSPSTTKPAVSNQSKTGSGMAPADCTRQCAATPKQYSCMLSHACTKWLRHSYLTFTLMPPTWHH